MSGSDPYYEDNPEAAESGQLNSENNFGFNPNSPTAGNAPTYTYVDREAEKSPDDMSTYDREQQNNEAARDDAGDVAPNSQGDEGVTSNFTAGDYLDVDNTTILEHAKMLSFESPSFIYKAAAGWNSMSIALYASADALQAKAQALSDKWTSDQAKSAFMSRVGASTFSMREWAALADANHTANAVLHEYVSSAQTQMETLYKEFSSWLDQAKQAERVMAVSSPGADCLHAATLNVSKTDKVNIASQILNAYFQEQGCGCYQYTGEGASAGFGPVYAVIKKYSDLSRSGPMASADTGFWEAFAACQRSAQVWRGLTNSAAADTAALYRLAGLLPSAPGVPGMPGAGGMPATPAVPAIPAMPPMPAVPNMVGMLQQPFNQQAMDQLKGMQQLAQRLAMNQSQLAALQAMLNAMQAKSLAEQLAAQQAALEAKAAADAAAASQAQLTAAAAAASQAQQAAAQLSAEAQKLVDTSGLQAALANVQANMPSAPGAPGMGDPAMPAFGMPGYTGGPGGMPSLPGMGTAAGSGGLGSPLAPPIAGRPGAGRPGVPNLVGRNAGAGAGPKSFATKVNLPGRGGSVPGAVPPGGGAGPRPTIGGRATPVTKTSGASGVPGMTTPRSLSGRNNEAVRRIVSAHGLKGLGAASGIGALSGLAGRALGRPDKSENLARARSAMRRSLQGRTVMETEESRRIASRAAAAARAARQHSPYLQRQEEQASQTLAKIGLIDDHELFDVARAGNGIIAKPGASIPVKKAGPALGSS